jgi:hypothetical protein
MLETAPIGAVMFGETQPPRDVRGDEIQTLVPAQAGTNGLRRTCNHLGDGFEPTEDFARRVAVGQ